ncbi:MAG: thermonuclease family protein [Actinomycetota bacterium]
MKRCWIAGAAVSVLLVFMVGCADPQRSSSSPSAGGSSENPKQRSHRKSSGPDKSARGSEQTKEDSRPRKGEEPRDRPEDQHGPTALVSRVIDGDTIEVQLRGTTTDVRLIGIDTPETVHPTVGVECYGPAASHFTTSRLEGQRVQLEFDVERIDRYGRTLAYVWMGDSLFNATLVRSGHAQVSTYPPNVKYVDRFVAAQRKARAANRGLWGGCSGEKDPTSSSAANPSASSGGDKCTPGYSPCLPPASDYDCAGGSGDGPKYVEETVHVTGSDPYELDSDGDGLGCE